MYVIIGGPLAKKASFPNWACRLYPISEITWFRFQCSRKSIEKLKICSVFCSLILKFPAHRMQQKVPKLWNLSKNSMLRKGSEVSRFWKVSEKHTKFEKIFLVVLTNQLIYIVNVKTMRKIFFQIMCASQKIKTLFESLEISFSHHLF